MCVEEQHFQTAADVDDDDDDGDGVWKDYLWILFGLDVLAVFP